MALIVAWRRCVLALLLALAPAGTQQAFASDAIELAQAQSQAQPQAQPAPQPTPTPAPSTAAPAADAQAAPEEPIGNVATVTGIATVIRNKNSIALKLRDDIYLNDTVQTASNSSLGITFNDSTTFNLSASAKITIDTYIYEDGGKQNSAIFDVGRGTVAFVAAAVAKTGDMKITTPTASLGIRGTTGVVEVPDNPTTAANAANNVNIKLYPDADGRVGRIEVNDRTSGGRLGFLTQAASGFAIRPGSGGVRFAAVPIAISPQQVQRDQSFVRQVYAAQTTGRQIVTEQREFRRANPGVINPNAPRRQGLPGQPLQPRQNGLPGQQQPQNGQPGQNRPGQPGAPNRQGTLPGTKQGTPSPRRQGGALQPGTLRNGPGQQGTGQQGTGQGQQTGTPRNGQNGQPASTLQNNLPRNGQTPLSTTTPQPGVTPLPQMPRNGQQQGQPVVAPVVQPQQNGLRRQPGLQQLPVAPRSGQPVKPAPRKPAPKEKERR